MKFQIQSIKKQFNEKVILDNITYDFSRPGFYLITGKSGAGKSTLLNIMAGFDHDYEGKVVLEDMERICIFQNFELLDELTVEQNISLSEHINGISCPIKDSIILQLGIDRLLKHYPRELSIGQQQRVSIARALSSHANIYLCDEPTESLDYVNTRKVLELLYQLSNDHVVIVVTHHPELVAQYHPIILHIDNKHMTCMNKSDTLKYLEKPKEKHYQKLHVYQYVTKITKYKTRKQIMMIGIFMLVITLMIIIYGKIFSYKDHAHNINRESIYVRTVRDVQNIPDTKVTRILSFGDYVSQSSKSYPVKVVPYHYSEGFEYIGSHQLSQGNEIIINQNMASLLADEFQCKEENLINHTIHLSLITYKDILNIPFQIKGIVYEDAGLYLQIYYDKIKLDKNLENQSYDSIYSLYDMAYWGNQYYEVESQNYKKIYDKLQKQNGYNIFNIEKAQNEDYMRGTYALMPYYMTLMIMMMIFVIVMFIYNAYRNWKYHLGAFASLVSFGARPKDITYIYIKNKMFPLVMIMIVLNISIILLDVLWIQRGITLLLFVYSFLVLTILLITLKILTRKLQYTNIANILKDDKEIR